MSLFGFLKRDLDSRKKLQEDQTAENVLDNEPVSSSSENDVKEQSYSDTTAATCHFEIKIPEEELDNLCKIIGDQEIREHLKKIDWKNPSVSTLTEFIRQAVNSSGMKRNADFRNRFIKYLASVLVSEYSINNPVYYDKNDETVKNIDEFMHILIQAVFDACLIHGIDFYEIFLLIKNITVYRNNSYMPDCSLGCRYRFSFSHFTGLWDNCKSKFIIDREDSYIVTIVDIINSFFEEFLENATSKDIEALHKFYIRYENVFDNDAFSSIMDAISDGYYEPAVYLRFDAEKGISRYAPDLLVNSYINKLNSIAYDMSIAREENNPCKIRRLESAICDTIATIDSYIEYRSEDFTSYFNFSWEYVLDTIIHHFSGTTLNLFSDFLMKNLKISKYDIDESIASYVLDILIDYGSGEKKSISMEEMEKIYRILSNKTAFDMVNAINPAIISVF